MAAQKRNSSPCCNAVHHLTLFLFNPFQQPKPDAAMKSAGHPYLTTLTPLRGIAALLVVIFHCNLMFRQFLPTGYTKYLDSCWLWVDFFFVLSGFIMFYAYKKYFKESVSIASFKKY